MGNYCNQEIIKYNVGDKINFELEWKLTFRKLKKTKSGEGLYFMEVFTFIFAAN